MKKFAFSVLAVFALFAVLSPALFAAENKEAKLVIQLTLDKSSPVDAYRLQNGNLTFTEQKFSVTELDHHKERIIATTGEIQTDANGAAVFVFTYPDRAGDSERYLIEDENGLFFEVVKVSADGTICFFANDQWNCTNTGFFLAKFPLKTVTGLAAYTSLTKKDFDAYDDSKNVAQRKAEQIRVLLGK